MAAALANSRLPTSGGTHADDLSRALRALGRRSGNRSSRRRGPSHGARTSLPAPCRKTARKATSIPIPPWNAMSSCPAPHHPVRGARRRRRRRQSVCRARWTSRITDSRMPTKWNGPCGNARTGPTSIIIREGRRLPVRNPRLAPGRSRWPRTPKPTRSSLSSTPAPRLSTPSRPPPISSAPPAPRPWTRRRPGPCKAGQTVYLHRNGSSLLAFRLPAQSRLGPASASASWRPIPTAPASSSSPIPRTLPPTGPNGAWRCTAACCTIPGWTATWAWPAASPAWARTARCAAAWCAWTTSPCASRSWPSTWTGASTIPGSSSTPSATWCR